MVETTGSTITMMSDTIYDKLWDVISWSQIDIWSGVWTRQILNRVLDGAHAEFTSSY